MAFFPKIAALPVRTFDLEDLQLPPSVSWTLNLGPKFVPGSIFTAGDYKKLQTGLEDLEREFRNMVFLNWTPKLGAEHRESLVRTLPEARSVSTWIAPRSDPILDAAFADFRGKAIDRAPRLLRRDKGPPGNVLYRHGMEVLRRYHEQHRLCVRIAGKGCGFSIVAPDTVSRANTGLHIDEKVAVIDPQNYAHSLWEMSHYIKYLTDKALLDGIISQRTHGAITPAELCNIRLEQTSELVAELPGSIRVMPKLHKLPNRELRQVENDIHNPFAPLAAFTAKAIQKLVDEFAYTTVPSSTKVIKQINDLGIPLAPGPSMFLTASDIVDYFGCINLDVDLPVVQRYIAQKNAKSGGHLSQQLPEDHFVQ